MNGNTVKLNVFIKVKVLSWW